MSSITVKDEPIVEKMVQMGRGHLMDVVHKPDLPPRVSVIIPTYNRAQMVCACVDSVLRSDWPDMEVIVADDCSPDDTRRMVEERNGTAGGLRAASISRVRGAPDGAWRGGREPSSVDDRILLQSVDFPGKGRNAAELSSEQPAGRA